MIAVGDPFPSAGFLAAGEPQPLAARHLTQALVRWFDVSITQQLGKMRTETRPGGVNARDDSL